ncbi:MAG: LamG-like jellyroll fold domain-containing protein [Pseudomonadota bacterium]
MLKFAISWIYAALLLAVSVSVYAGQATLAWVSPNEPGIYGYRIYYGQSSRNYPLSINVGNQTSYTVTGLQEGKTYYFAVKTIGASGESVYSNEVSKLIPKILPVANFSATPLTGIAPLTVSFDDSSTGSITNRLWNFGNGASSTATNTLTSYTLPGTYTVNLTVTGPGGTDTEVKTGYITVVSADTGGGTGSGGGDSGTVGGGTGTISGGGAGLVAAYSFDEEAGTIVADVSGNGNNGEILGAKRSAQGKYGKALLFDGVDDWVTVADADLLDLEVGMTIEAWVNPTTTLTSWRTVVMKEQPGGSIYYLAANSDANTPASGIYIGTEQILFSGTPPVPNKWTHLTVTYDGVNQRLYIDGTEVGSQPMSGPIQRSNGALRIGGNSLWGEYFTGYIDEVRIYNRALSASEIRTDIDTALTRSFADKSLVAAYGFDEADGVIVNDISGSGNHGEILGAKRSANGKFGQALLFDGVDDWVTVADAGLLDLETGMTVEGWVNPTTTLTNWRTLVMKEQLGGAVYYLSANTNSNTPASGVYIGAEQVLYAGRRLMPGKWTHLAMTYDGVNQRLYIDGTEVSSQLLSGPIQRSNGVLRIGGNSLWGEYFKGYIDEVRIYNRALSASEIQADISTGLIR